MYVEWDGEATKAHITENKPKNLKWFIQRKLLLVWMNCLMCYSV